MADTRRHQSDKFARQLDEATTNTEAKLKPIDFLVCPHSHVLLAGSRRITTRVTQAAKKVTFLGVYQFDGVMILRALRETNFNVGAPAARKILSRQCTF